LGNPYGCLIIFHPLAVMIHPPDVIHGSRITLFRCFLIPVQGFGVIHFNTIALLVHKSNIVHCNPIACFRCLPVPRHGCLGSWCEPCRKSTPHLIQLFKKYKDNGLDVIAVAQEYDTTHVAWVAAIKKDGTEIWYNVLNDKKADKDIVRMFGVLVYPTKILIDKTGRIIGRYRGTDDGPALDKKLSELFD
jgi:thiol-disulfide isomerase/thioredoxin